jgi:uncharacterized membrane protein
MMPRPLLRRHPMTSAYLILALMAAAAYGASDFLGGLASRRSPTIAVVVISQALALLSITIGAPLVGGAASTADLLWGAVAGLAYGSGLLLLYRGLASGQMSVVAAVTGVCTISLPVLFGLLVGEEPGVWALVGIGLATLSILLVSGGAAQASSEDDVEPPSIARPSQKGGVIGMAMVAGLAFGCFFIALSRTQPEAGLWPLLATRGVTMCSYLVIAAWTRQSLRLDPSSLKLALCAGALDIGANTLYLLSVRGGLLSLAATLTSMYPATTVLLASVVLRERLPRRQAIGLSCAAAAVLLIATARSD